MIGLMEAAQAAQEAAKSTGPSAITLIGLGVLVVSNVGMWLDKFVQMSKNKVSMKEARARVAEAHAEEVKVQARSEGAGKGGNGQLAHEKYILPHSLTLEGHEKRIGANEKTLTKIESENRQDHGKIFEEIGAVKNILIERLPLRRG